MSGLDDGKRKTERGWSPGDSLNLVRVLSVRVNYSQQCRNDINGRWEYSKSIMLVFSAYRSHLMGLNIVSDHIWHSEAGGAIGIDQQTFVFKISVDEKCCERR